jgi:hypothetical protein
MAEAHGNSAAAAAAVDLDKAKGSQISDGDAASSSQNVGRQGIGIDSMFDMLDIGEEEFNDFVLEEDLEEIKVNTRLLAVARVHCPKNFSHEAFFQQMRLAWNPAREITMRAVGINRFVIQCFCLGDWEKVMERGPWLFRDWAVILAPYDGLSDPDEVSLEFLPIWLQVHKLPEGYRKEKYVRPLVSRVAGEIEAVEMNPAGGFKGDYVRVRVKHDVRTALTRWVSFILEGKRMLYMVKYEKLGLFCHACGLLGHEYKECGTGLFEANQLKWGEWFHAFPSGRGRGNPQRGGLRGGVMAFNARGGRSEFIHGRGRGEPGAGHGRGYVDWRLHPERRSTDDGDLQDTDSSPTKTGDVVMSEAEKAARKRLAFEDGSYAADGVSPNLNPALLLTTHGVEAPGDVDKENSSDSKRHKSGGDNIGHDTHPGSAASLEDDRRVQ